MFCEEGTIYLILGKCTKHNSPLASRAQTPNWHEGPHSTRYTYCLFMIPHMWNVN